MSQLARGLILGTKGAMEHGANLDALIARDFRCQAKILSMRPSGSGMSATTKSMMSVTASSAIVV